MKTNKVFIKIQRHFYRVMAPVIEELSESQLKKIADFIISELETIEKDISLSDDFARKRGFSSARSAVVSAIAYQRALIREFARNQKLELSLKGNKKEDRMIELIRALLREKNEDQLIVVYLKCSKCHSSFICLNEDELLAAYPIGEQPICTNCRKNQSKRKNKK